jgi:hypothetical protein
LPQAVYPGRPANWVAFHAYATTDPGILLPTSSGGNGNCPPPNIYKIFNYYCDSNTSEEALPAAKPCSAVTPQLISEGCKPVEAYIDTMITRGFVPVFYKCYWYSPTPGGLEILEFEWSATAEYIKWYVDTIIGGGNDVYSIIGGTPAIGYYVPLLKVTNHSPTSY